MHLVSAHGGRKEGKSKKEKEREEQGEEHIQQAIMKSDPPWQRLNTKTKRKRGEEEGPHLDY